jgi:Protein of unknown function (DUF3108)
VPRWASPGCSDPCVPLTPRRRRGRVRGWFAAGLCLLLVYVLAASPAARADDVSALYRATWAGLPAAHIRLTLHDGGGAYRVEIAVGSEGLPSLVTHFRGTAAAQGKLDSGGAPAPVRYDANYDLRHRKDRQLRMNFVVRDNAIFAERGAGDTSRKPELKEQFRRNVVDPLSVITMIRAAVRRGETAFTIPVYDGARRFNAEVRVLPRDPKNAGVHLALMLKAIAGFKGETSEDGDPDDAPRPASLTLSDDERLIPLAMSVKIWFLPLDTTLERVCATATPCGW